MVQRTLYAYQSLRPTIIRYFGVRNVMVQRFGPSLAQFPEQILSVWRESLADRHLTAYDVYIQGFSAPSAGELPLSSPGNGPEALTGARKVECVLGLSYFLLCIV
jgi:hypothetical protein